MNGCSNLVFLTTLACQFSEYLSEDELSLLSANLSALSSMLSAIIAQQDICNKNSTDIPLQ